MTEPQVLGGLDTQGRRLLLLERLYDFRGHSAPGIHKLLHDVLDENSEDLWRGTLRTMKHEGLIHLGEGFGSVGAYSAWLTDDGRAVVERLRQQRAAEDHARQARRTDPIQRRTAAANGLLRWLSEQDPSGLRWHKIDDVLGSAHVVFEDEPLPLDVISEAAENLRKRGLISGEGDLPERPGPFLLQITADGQDCIDSGDTVTDYLRQKNDRGPSVNFHAPVSGNVSWNSSHVTQTATTTTGLAGDELRALVRAIVEAIPALGLNDEQTTAVNDHAAAVEGELMRPEPDQHVVKTFMRRLTDTLAGAAASNLAPVLIAGAKELMKNVGLPIE